MFIKRQFRGIAVITLFIFTYLTLTLDYSHGQAEDPLAKARELYDQRNLQDAEKVLKAFIKETEGDQAGKKKLAEAYYLLAHTYYDLNEADTRVNENLKLAVEADINIGIDEGDLDFKARLWEERLKIEAAKKEAEMAKINVQEKEKSTPQIKKKKKFPWLLAILGIGVVVSLAVLLTKKKKQPQLGATFENGVLAVKGMRYEMALIPSGRFMMGSDSMEAWDWEKPAHLVIISRNYWLGKTEVTQGLWQAVMGSNPSYFQYGYSYFSDNYPVEKVSWYDCQAFVQKLNQMLDGNAFRLPFEAEWEYACRAGTTEDRYGEIDAIAWWGSRFGTTRQVAQKQQNPWGLFDMLGNVREWCQDWYGQYPSEYQMDPTGPFSGDSRVARGGSYSQESSWIRSPWRGGVNPIMVDIDLGFRLARSM